MTCVWEGACTPCNPYHTIFYVYTFAFYLSHFLSFTLAPYSKSLSQSRLTMKGHYQIPSTIFSFGNLGALASATIGKKTGVKGFSAEGTLCIGKGYVLSTQF